MQSTIFSPGLLAEEIIFLANFKIDFALAHHIQGKNENQHRCSTPICLQSCGYCVPVRGTDIFYIERLSKNNYVTIWCINPLCVRQE